MAGIPIGTPEVPINNSPFGKFKLVDALVITNWFAVNELSWILFVINICQYSEQLKQYYHNKDK